jgi:hypothetical protein
MTEGKEAHWEVVERILFLYAKLNPGQSYVQGMNEIIGPIYHAFASDPDVNFRGDPSSKSVSHVFTLFLPEHAESDSFFCFTNLMSEIRDFFIKSLDETDHGINKMMNRMLVQLKNSDLDVWLKFQQLELKPQYYSFRSGTLVALATIEQLLFQVDHAVALPGVSASRRAQDMGHAVLGRVEIRLFDLRLLRHDRVSDTTSQSGFA